MKFTEERWTYSDRIENQEIDERVQALKIHSAKKSNNFLEKYF